MADLESRASEGEVTALLTDIVANADLASITARDVRSKLKATLNGRKAEPGSKWLKDEIKRITLARIEAEAGDLPREEGGSQAQHDVEPEDMTGVEGDEDGDGEGVALGETDVTAKVAVIVAQADLATETTRDIYAKLKKEIKGQKLAPGKKWVRLEIKRLTHERINADRAGEADGQEDYTGEEEAARDDGDGVQGVEEPDNGGSSDDEKSGVERAVRSQKSDESSVIGEDDDGVPGAENVGVEGDGESDDADESDNEDIKVVFGSESDDEIDVNRGHLMADIFGADDDDVDFGTFEQDDTEAEANEALKRVMMKKQAKKRKKQQELEEEDHTRADAQQPRGRRRASVIDPEVYRDRTARFVGKMRQAAIDDGKANEEGRPAINKMKMMKDLEAQMQIVQLQQLLIENDFLAVLKLWLDPLPDKSLPSLSLRTMLLHRLQDFPVQKEDLLHSRLGHAVMFLRKHPAETRENKLLARDLIQAWSRPIFGQTTDYREVVRSYQDRALPDVRQRKRPSSGSDPTKTKVQRSDDFTKLLDAGSGYREQTDRLRARIPQPTLKDYTRMPVPSLTYDRKTSTHRSRALHQRMTSFKAKSAKRVGSGR